MATRSKLAVILHADIVGSTALVQRDERIAHERIQAAFRRFSATISAYGGVARELRGDALVAEFERASDALSATLAFQAENGARNGALGDDIRPVARVGVALGEVVVADGTLTGAGVVLAQRLEQLAEPGGLCISAAVREAVPARLPLEYASLGEREVKGFDEPVRAFSVSVASGGAIPAPEAAVPSPSPPAPPRRGGRRAIFGAILGAAVAAAGLAAWWHPWEPGIEPADPARMAHALPDIPSVAVLPFDNLSEDGDQGFFADGVTEDIITDLSKISGLFVVARNSTFAYKDEPVPIRQVAEDLGVRYVLEGSVRRSGDRIRVTAQLIDALEGNHLWAERYDRQLEDVFDIQSEISRKVSKALAVTLKAGEIERLFLRQTTSIEAYDEFLRARRLADAPGRENVERAEALFRHAIELDPGFASAYAGLSFNYSVKARFHLTDTPEADARRSLEFALEAIDRDRNLAWGYIALGGAHLANGDAGAAVEAVRQAVNIQPNGYEANLFMGLYLQFAGQAAEAVEHLERAQRLNPVDTVRKLAFLGMAYFMNGDYDKAEAVFRKRYERFPVAKSELSLVFLAAARAMLGETKGATEAAEMVLEVNPGFHLAGWRWLRSYSSPEYRRRLYDAAMKAGLPEHPSPKTTASVPGG